MFAFGRGDRFCCMEDGCWSCANTRNHLLKSRSLIHDLISVPVCERLQNLLIKINNPGPLHRDIIRKKIDAPKVNLDSIARKRFDGRYRHETSRFDLLAVEILEVSVSLCIAEDDDAVVAIIQDSFQFLDVRRVKEEVEDGQALPSRVPVPLAILNDTVLTFVVDEDEVTSAHLDRRIVELLKEKNSGVAACFNSYYSLHSPCVLTKLPNSVFSTREGTIEATWRQNSAIDPISLLRYKGYHKLSKCTIVINM
ncbi:hypothetical protein KCU81_g176, partial [Aureobasidium melanogenum]